MTYDPLKHHRRSVRLLHFDYGSAGAYYLTICVHRRRCVFGRIENGVMHLNQYGRIVEKEWLRSPEIRPEIALDEFIVMPNHFHGIVWILPDGDAPVAPPDGIPRKFEAPSRTASALANGFKGAVKIGINALRATEGRATVTVWQRGFYDHIIRDEDDLNRIRRYIRENPLNWETDDHHPNHP